MWQIPEMTSDNFPPAPTKAAPSTPLSPSVSLAVRFVSVLGLTYVLSQFLRTSNAVIANDLATELSLSPVDLGVLTGAFFLSFALVQLPVGMLLDRFGPRRVMAAFLVLNVAGTMLFASAENMQQLTLARALMGLGCSPLLMGAFVIYARWFPASRFATYSGLQLGVGNFGLLLSTVPLAMAVDAWGWRLSMGGTGVWAAVAALVILLVIRDAPKDHPVHAQAHEGLAQSLAGIGELLRDRRLWPLMPIQFTGYAAVASVSALWGGPYLADVHGLDILARGNVLLLMGMGSIAGAFLFGPLDRVFNSRKKVVMAGASLASVLFIVLGVVDGPGVIFVGACFAGLAMLGGYMLVLTAHARAFFSDRLMGRGLTLTNMLNMGGVAVMQVATGALLGSGPESGPDSGLSSVARTEGDYQTIFLFMGVVVALATMVYSRSKDVAPFVEAEADHTGVGS